MKAIGLCLVHIFNWSGPSAYICTLKSQINNECTDLANRRLGCVCLHVSLQSL